MRTDELQVVTFSCFLIIYACWYSYFSRVICKTETILTQRKMNQSVRGDLKTSLVTNTVWSSVLIWLKNGRLSEYEALSLIEKFVNYITYHGFLSKIILVKCPVVKNIIKYSCIF